MKRLAVAAGSLAALLVLSACGSSSDAGTSSAASAAAPSSSAAPVAGSSAATADKITINNFTFSGTMTVKPGAKVMVVNNDSTAHTLTDKKTNKFDTGNIPAGGGTGTFTAPTKPGKYPFGCTYHPEMAGTLIVSG